MAFKYTGRARTLQYNNKIYAEPETYAKNPRAFDGSFDKPIPGMSRELAMHLASQSNMHSFEEDGEDILEVATAPFANVPDGDISTVRPESIVAKKS